MEFVPSMTQPMEDMVGGFEETRKATSEWTKDTIGMDILEGVDGTEYAKWRITQNFCATHQYMVTAMVETEIPEPFKTQFLALTTGFLVLDPSLQMQDVQQFGGIKGLRQLQDFLDADSRVPVYIGWGSMPIPMPILIKFLLVLKMSKQRGIVCAGWGESTFEGVKNFITTQMGGEDQFGIVEFAEKDVIFCKVAPHEWLFPRCSCTIHHGGAGTTCAALLSPLSWSISLLGGTTL